MRRRRSIRSPASRKRIFSAMVYAGFRAGLGASRWAALRSRLAWRPTFGPDRPAVRIGTPRASAPWPFGACGAAAAPRKRPASDRSARGQGSGPATDRRRVVGVSAPTADTTREPPAHGGDAVGADVARRRPRDGERAPSGEIPSGVATSGAESPDRWAGDPQGLRAPSCWGVPDSCEAAALRGAPRGQWRRLPPRAIGEQALFAAALRTWNARAWPHRTFVHQPSHEHLKACPVQPGGGMLRTIKRMPRRRRTRDR